MPTLKNFPVANQKDDNSCWACAARMIINWFERNRPEKQYPTDEALAKAWSEITGEAENADLSIQQSASALLEDLGHETGMDGNFMPNAGEIKGEIENGKPLLAYVKNTRASRNPETNEPNDEVHGGHWVVIVGISEDSELIEVFDPARGDIRSVPYSDKTYENGVYWQHTSYVDAKKQ